ncbi:MAG: protein kinase [Labilithrix sp.]|nr:protein kinase [Labilithrix sp.]
MPRRGDIFAEKYVVERILGFGGMGVVFAATHVHLREPVAIKMMLPKLTDRGAEERFLREAQAAVKIRSEHVVRVLDVADLPDRTPYIVMEYLEGTDLSALLRRHGPLHPERAVDYVLQASEAIAKAHALGTVHRDLKPSNLFLTRTDEGVECVKVLDFGISKVEQPSSDVVMTKTTDVLGTPLYMSPEQLKNSRDVDHRADIWALGVLLYELIAGAPPFQAKSVAELGAAILSGKAPWLADAAPHVPRALSHVVATCLRLEAADRFVNMADFADAVAPFGGAHARARVDRIVRTVGMPTVRAKYDPETAFAATDVGALRPSREVAPAPPIAVSAKTTLSSSLESLPPGHEIGAARPRRVALAVAVPVLLLAIAAAGIVGYRAELFPRRAATSSTAVSSPAPPLLSSEPESAATTEAPPAAPPSASEGPSAIASAAMSSAPAPTTSARPAPTTLPTPRASATPADRLAPRTNCTPPFEFDATGKKIWKRECL